MTSMLLLLIVTFTSAPPPPTLTVEAALDKEDPGKIVITITNNSSETIGFKWQLDPLSIVGFAAFDGKGKAIDVTHPTAYISPTREQTKEKQLDIESKKTQSLGTSLLLLFHGGQPNGDVKIVVSVKHDGTTYKSDGLIVKKAK
jgi:hypothetical protein